MCCLIVRHKQLITKVLNDILVCWTLRINAGVSWAGKWGKVVLKEMPKIAYVILSDFAPIDLRDKESEVEFVWPIEIGLRRVEGVELFRVKNTGRWSEKLSTESIDIILLVLFKIRTNNMINPGKDWWSSRLYVNEISEHISPLTRSKACMKHSRIVWLGLTLAKSTLKSPVMMTWSYIWVKRNPSNSAIVSRKVVVDSSKP